MGGCGCEADWGVFVFTPPPPQWGGVDLDSRNSGCARLGGGVGPPLGVVVEEVAVLVVFVESEALFVVVLPRRGCEMHRMTPICVGNSS